MLPAEVLDLLETCLDFNLNLFHFVLCCEIIFKEKLESLKIHLQIFFTRPDSKVEFRTKKSLGWTNKQAPSGHWKLFMFVSNFHCR